MSLLKRIENLCQYLYDTTKHKLQVGRYCWKAGLYSRALLHDGSKYRLAELKSAWSDTEHTAKIRLHNQHVKCNYTYWLIVDNDNVITIPMPYKYAVEFICDYLAKHRDKYFKYGEVWHKWLHDRSKYKYMDSHTLDFISSVLETMSREKSTTLLGDKQRLKEMYIYSLT